jgi:hypothetical protein
MNTVISILNKLKRDFKIHGVFSKKVRNKAKFFEKNHKGYYKKMTGIMSYKIMENFRRKRK